MRALGKRVPPARGQADQTVAVVGDEFLHHRVFPHADARAAAPRLAHLLAPARTLRDPGEELAHDQADGLGHGVVIARALKKASSFRGAAQRRAPESMTTALECWIPDSLASLGFRNDELRSSLPE